MGSRDDRLALAAAAHRDGRLEEAIGHYRNALDDAPGTGPVWQNLGVALAQSGDPAGALEAFDRALAIDPNYVHAHLNRGGALETLGRHADAASAYRRALAIAPGLYEIQRRAGLMHLATGDVSAAEDAFAKTRAIRRDPAAMGEDHPQFARTTRAKLRHDAAQFRHLSSRSIDAERFAALAASYEAALASLGPAAGLDDEVEIQDDAIRDTHNRALHDGSKDRVVGSVLGPAFDPQAIEAAYSDAEIGFVVIDDLLSSAALERLQRYLLEATVWHDFQHIPGFLAAYLEDGLAPPVLLQLVAELRERLPGVLGPYPLQQAWAFKGLSGDRGIDVHADAGAVSVNLWLTSDAAGSGGLTIHHAPPPDAWGLEDYHRDIPRIRAHLADAPAGASEIAYAQNRAVLFRSRLFHESGPVVFRPGYENHRVNLTLLFGRPEDL